MLAFSKLEKWNAELFLILYNPQEKVHPRPDGEDERTEEYTSRVFVPEVSRKELINALVRERYTEADEIALAFGREADAEKLAAHEEFVADCRALADRILEALEV